MENDETTATLAAASRLVEKLQREQTPLTPEDAELLNRAITIAQNMFVEFRALANRSGDLYTKLVRDITKTVVAKVRAYPEEFSKTSEKP